MCFVNVPVHAVEEHIVQVPHVKPLPAFRAAFEMSALGPGQLPVVGIRHGKIRSHRTSAGEIGWLPEAEAAHRPGRIFQRDFLLLLFARQLPVHHGGNRVMQHGPICHGVLF